MVSCTMNTPLQKAHSYRLGVRWRYSYDDVLTIKKSISSWIAIKWLLHEFVSVSGQVSYSLI